ncbi:MAG: GldG family protein [Dehalococcoidales bacterium]|nr:MAG: GldG family protein [Dehalococcoidales bacterium]
MPTGLMALLGLASLFIGWILTIILPQLRAVSWGILALGAILIITALVLDYRQVGKAISSRRGRFSTGATIMVSVFIGIILLVNAISYANHQQWDVTGLSQYVLTSQTKEVLDNLDQEVEIIQFFVPDDPIGGTVYATSLLDKYEVYTDKLTVRTIDPDIHPEEAREYGVKEYHEFFYMVFGIPAQSIVFIGEFGQRIILIPPSLGSFVEDAEHDFTSAILEVTGTVQKVAYFVTGHGEVDITNTSAAGYSTASDGLRDNLYKTVPINLLTAGAVPDDASALIIAAPQIPLSSAEINIIEEYLGRDGRLMILVNPASPESFEQLLQPWGVQIEQGFVWEGGTSYVASIGRDSPRVPGQQNSFGLATLYFPGTTSISTPLEGYEIGLVGPEENREPVWINEEAERVIQISALAITSEDSWLENSGSSLEPELDEGVDIEGPLTISYLVESVRIEESGDDLAAVPDGPRLLVIGDSDFATNTHIQNDNNSDFFLSSIEFLTAGTELISMDRKILQSRPLIIGPEVTTFITISSIGLLPLLLLVAGTIVWWRRR